MNTETLEPFSWKNLSGMVITSEGYQSRKTDVVYFDEEDVFELVEWADEDIDNMVDMLNIAYTFGFNTALGIVASEGE